ncbi:hypothetical protein GWI33_003100 [Rhynchophorus ferrugineus]|uniref:Uncharacterized protein n=1 Tax=Rhynchophorus ferrugineus TaxID=354439 RepID=A0A834MF74_RHYFE|nr:hypothetical protein GWI33_003100 [Rhynchophorus ferrugineus]
MQMRTGDAATFPGWTPRLAAPSRPADTRAQEMRMRRGRRSEGGWVDGRSRGLLINRSLIEALERVRRHI